MGKLIEKDGDFMNEMLVITTAEQIANDAATLVAETEAYVSTQQAEVIGTISLGGNEVSTTEMTTFEALSDDGSSDPSAAVPEIAAPGRTRYTMPTGPETDYRSFDI